MHACDPHSGIIFYAQVQKNGFGCWNTRTPFTIRNHVDLMHNNKTMIYPSDINVCENYFSLI